MQSDELTRAVLPFKERQVGHDPLDVRVSLWHLVLVSCASREGDKGGGGERGGHRDSGRERGRNESGNREGEGGTRGGHREGGRERGRNERWT